MGQAEPLPASAEPMTQTEPLPGLSASETEALSEAVTEPFTEIVTETVTETESVAEPVTEPAETPTASAEPMVPTDPMAPTEPTAPQTSEPGTASEIRDFVPVKPVPVVPVSAASLSGTPSGSNNQQPEPVLPAEPGKPEAENPPAYAVDPPSVIEPQKAEPPQPLDAGDAAEPSTPPAPPEQPAEPAVTKKPAVPEPAEKEEQHPNIAPEPVTEPAVPTKPMVPEVPVTPQEPAAPAETEEIRVSFLGAGDSVVHEGIFKEAAKWAKLNGNGRDYDFSHLFTDVKYQIAGADIAFINQETPMAGESYGYSGYPLFNTPRDLAWDLVGTGFDVVNLANNHMLDQGAEGLRSNIGFWQAMSCTEIGGYRDQADYDDIRVVERNGVKVAFLSYCTMTNGFTLDSSSPIVIPYLDENVIRRQTAAARKLADFVVVSVHWGEDNVQYVTNDQKNWAKLFADCGVDVILGHHPHLIQPIEWLTGENGNRCLCAYSLGNLYSLMAESKNMVGGFLKFDFVKTGDETSIQNVRFVPTVFFYKTSFFGQRIYFMKDYTEALAAAHGTQTYDTELLTAAQLADYVAEVIDARFLPVNWGPQG